MKITMTTAMAPVTMDMVVEAVVEAWSVVVAFVGLSADR